MIFRIKYLVCKQESELTNCIIQIRISGQPGTLMVGQLVIQIV